MPLPTITAISGPYTVTWNGTSLGVTEDGIELEHVTFVEPVRGDNLGDSKQDGVYRGGDVFVNFVLQEYSVANLALGPSNGKVWHPYHQTFGTIGVVGNIQTNYSAPLVFTAVAGTPAANQPTTVEIFSAILAENFPIRLLFAARHRKIPMRMQALPDEYTGASTPSWYAFS